MEIRNRLRSVICVAILCSLISLSNAQTSFKKQSGDKATYTVEIPSTFVASEKVGANVDLKFADKYGASIITVVKKLPQGYTPKLVLASMDVLTNDQIKDQYEMGGLDNVNVIKKGRQLINGREVYVLLMSSGEPSDKLYNHQVSYFFQGKMVVLTFACSLETKSKYLPYINRVISSFKY